MRLSTCLIALCGAALAACSAPEEGPCQTRTFENLPYLVCSFDTSREDVRLFLRDEAGVPFGQFDRLANHVASQGGNLVFAMNAGMYHEDRRPVGLYIEEGEAEMGLVRSAGPGNFGMLPNGVFCSGGAQPFAVVESRAFAQTRPDCRLATQSGPMLVIEGELHPRFLVD
jgi:uncharacterized protein YigE (DUF2233 family)